VAEFLTQPPGGMRVGMIDEQAIRQRWESVGSKLNERVGGCLQPERFGRRGGPGLTLIFVPVQ
jgi:hypothetical protein